MPEQALTVEEVAEREQVSDATVRTWLRRRQLPGYKLPGGDWRIEPSAYEAWRAARRQGENKAA